MNQQTIVCPCCLGEYSKLDAPDHYNRVLHVLNPRKSFLTKDDLDASQQSSIENYLKAARTTNHVDQTLLEQICAGLQELGVDCTWRPAAVVANLVSGAQWRFGTGEATWEGLLIDNNRLDAWVSDVPNTCSDVTRIVRAIFGQIKRFDYREYRPTLSSQ